MSECVGCSQTSSNDSTAPVVGNVIGYADCTEASCDCVPLSGGVRNITSGLTISQLVAVGAGATLQVIDQPTWATSALVGSDIQITGVAPSGLHILTYRVKNECSDETIVVKISAIGVCTPPSNIVKDIGYDNVSLKLEATIQAPNGGNIISHDIPSGSVALYGTELLVNSVVAQPFPSNYTILVSTECGDYTISGSITECKRPMLSSIGGSSVLEKGISANLSWEVEGTGNISVITQDGVPAGMSVSVQQNTPSSGFAKIVVSGSSSQDPGNGEIKIGVKGQCGSLALSRKFTQQPCRTIAVIGENGSSQILIGTPVNYCKIIRGYEPSVVEYENIPLGLSVSISPNGSNLNEWLVCLSGTPIIDPCKKSEGGKICECATIKLKNQCGNYDLEMCFNLDVGSINRPGYCVGVYDFDVTTKLLRVWGVTPNSTVSIASSFAGLPVSPTSIAIDSFGFGQATLTYADGAGQSYCITLAHPSCAMIRKSDSYGIYCYDYSPPDPI